VASADSLTLLLPSDENGPLPAIGDEDRPNASTLIAVPTPFVVPTLRLQPTDAIDLLVCLAEPLPATCGDSIRYWQHLARFVLDRLAAQQFFPEIAPGAQGRYFAHWRLLVSSERDATALEQFAAAMPPVCMA